MAARTMTRTILYGYEIRDGQQCVRADEADTVQRIFNLYKSGFSYQKLADTLNTEKVPYGENNSAWNKGKVKRMLEDRRYMGDRDWPVLIDPQTFQTVQTIIQERAANQTPKVPRKKGASTARRIHQYLRCGECETHLIANGCGGEYSDYIYLRCPQCGQVHGFPKADLWNKIEQQIKDHAAMKQAEYQPSAEVIRLTSQINRSMENPDQPEEAMRLILQAISARYDCCPEPKEINRETLTELTPRQMDNLITHISIMKDATVVVQFRE